MALNKLNAIAVRNLKQPGRHSDGGNLYLSIGKTGSRSWVFLYRRDGRLRELGLGSARDVSLAVAREKAKSARAALAVGKDPKSASKTIEAKTFGEVADAFIEAQEPSWRNAKHAAQWRMTLTHYAAHLRPMPVSEVSTSNVIQVLSPIWSTKPETASRLRGRIEAVLDAARAQGLRSGDNPAAWRGHLSAILPRRAKLGRGHHAAMVLDDLPAFMTRLRDHPSTSARALDFTILTAARTNEALGARWNEIAGETWTVPGERMKAKRPHRVPLSAAALSVIERQREVCISDLIFPGAKRDAPLSNMALLMVLRRLGAGVTAHGFRSTFRDWAAERTDFPGELAEMALAHAVGDKTEAAYRRGDLYQKRIELMEAWAQFCGGT